MKAGLLQGEVEGADWMAHPFQNPHCLVVSLPRSGSRLCALVTARGPCPPRSGPHGNWGAGLRLRARGAAAGAGPASCSQRGPSWSEVRVPPGAVLPELARPPALGTGAGPVVKVSCLRAHRVVFGVNRTVGAQSRCELARHRELSPRPARPGCQFSGPGDHVLLEGLAMTG